MGFGIALASGFIKESNAIARERAAQKAKEQDEERALVTFEKQEKIKSGFRQQEGVAAAEVAGNKAITAAKTKATAGRLKNMTDVFNGLESWEKPDFLQKNPDLAKYLGIANYGGDADITAMHQAMSKAEGTTLIPGTPLVGLWNFDGKSAKDQVTLTIRDMEAYLSNEENFNKWAKQLGDSGTSSSFVTWATNILEAEQFNKFNAETKDQSVVINLKGKAFRNINRFMESIGGEAGITLADEINIVYPDGVPENSFYIRNPSEDGNTLSTNHVTMNERDYANINALAGDLYKGKDGNWLMNNLGPISYSNNRSKQIESIKNAARLHSMDVLDLQNSVPNTEILNKVSQELYNIGVGSGDGTEINLNSQLSAVYSLFAANPALYPEIANIVSKETGSDFVGAAKAEKIEKVYKAAEKVVKMGEVLREVRGDIGASGVMRSIKEAVSGVFSQNGTLAQISNFTIGQGNLKENTDGSMTTTKQLQDSFASYSEKMGYNLEGAIGQARVLEFNLAVQIARANDPNGRLSNQDFEMALQSIGSTGFFSSTTRDFSALDTTIDIYREKRNDLEQLNNIASKSLVTRKDKLTLLAYDIVNKANEHNKNVGRSKTTKGLGSPAPTITEAGAARANKLGDENIVSIDFDMKSKSWFGIQKDNTKIDLNEDQLNTLFPSSPDN